MFAFPRIVPEAAPGGAVTVTGVAINGRAAHPEPDAERHPHHVLRGRRRDTGDDRHRDPHRERGDQRDVRGRST